MRAGTANGKGSGFDGLLRVAARETSPPGIVGLPFPETGVDAMEKRR